VRKRKFPLVGGGAGYFSWVHLDDAASATVLALEQQARGVFNIVDDERTPRPGSRQLFLETLAPRGVAQFPAEFPALLLLERLTPVERAVFVLRDVFRFSFWEIASAVGRSEAACRQLSVRARRYMDAGRS
jgi:DNA-directed RNA polymerase specialized sigma24 family protein